MSEGFCSYHPLCYQQGVGVTRAESLHHRGALKPHKIGLPGPPLVALRSARGESAEHTREI